MAIRTLGSRQILGRYFATATAALLLVCGCGGVSTGSDKKFASHSAVQVGEKAPTFSMPEIPPMVVGVEERRGYLVEHYWDGFDFSAEGMINSDEVRGGAVAGFVQLLGMCDTLTVQKGVEVALGLSLKFGYASFEKLCSTFEDYLFNPNSPMRDEEMYIYVLRYVVEAASLEDVYKLRSRRQLEMVLKNRVGEFSNDFKFITCQGVESSLYAVNSEYTILFFNTPDCEDCKRVKRYIEDSKALNYKVGSGVLKIIAVYPESDYELWRGADYPSLMINATDKEGVLRSEALYDLKALPTLYLLSKDKRVILKDVSIEQVVSRISPE
ncbi:MAG: DUF5106 domain-containing protein [Rikenellaceae bacterium]